MDRAGPDANAFGDKLTGREGVELVGGADDVDDALTELEELVPDVVLVSTDFGGGGCVGAVESLLAVMPRATLVMLSSRGDKALVQAGIRAGAAGALDRSASLGETISALHVHKRRQLGEDVDLALAEPAADSRGLRVSGALPIFPGIGSKASEPGVEAAGFADPWRDAPGEPVAEQTPEDDAAIGDDMDELRARLDAPAPKPKRGFRLFGRRKAKSKRGPATAGKDAELQKTRAEEQKES